MDYATEAEITIAMGKGPVIFKHCKILQEFHQQFTFSSICEMMDLNKPFSGADVLVIDQQTSCDHLEAIGTPKVFFDYLKTPKAVLLLLHAFLSLFTNFVYTTTYLIKQEKAYYLKDWEIGEDVPGLFAALRRFPKWFSLPGSPHNDFADVPESYMPKYLGISGYPTMICFVD